MSDGGNQAGFNVRAKMKKRKKNVKKEIGSLVFDYSFTSADFKNMDLTKVTGKPGDDSSEGDNNNMEVEDLTEADGNDAAVAAVPEPEAVRVPKLKLDTICKLKQALVRSGSQEGTTVPLSLIHI